MSNKAFYHFMFFLWTTFAFCATEEVALGITQNFTGVAMNASGGLEYIEQHALSSDPRGLLKSQTTYMNSENRIIGRLVSEYSGLPQHANYTFTDLRKDYEDGVLVEEDQICLFRKEGSQATKETVCLPKRRNQIAGQGFHHFIVKHLDAIAEGKIFHVHLAMPSRLDQFSFRIRKANIEGSKILIRLEIDNWFLRLIAPHVEVLYDRESGRLLRYEGISNIADSSGEFKKVQIKYFY